MGNNNQRAYQTYQQSEYNFLNFKGDIDILNYVRTIWSDLEKGYVCQDDPQKIFMLCTNGKARVLYEAFAKVLKDNAPKLEKNTYAKLVNSFIRIGYTVHTIVINNVVFPTLTEIAQYNSNFCKSNMAVDWEKTMVYIKKV